MRNDGVRWHRTQVELKTPRENRDRYLLGVGCCQYELQIFGRLFKRLQHRIEGRVGQHVDFVDHEHLEAPLDRLVNCLFEETLDLINTPIGSRVELGVVHKTALIDINTRLTHTTGLICDSALPIRTNAIQRFGQNSGDRGFTNAPGACKQIRMVQPLRRQRITQGLHNMGLANQLGEISRSVFSGENGVRHMPVILCAGVPHFECGGVTMGATGLPAW